MQLGCNVASTFVRYYRLGPHLPSRFSGGAGSGIPAMAAAGKETIENRRVRRADINKERSSSSGGRSTIGGRNSPAIKSSWKSGGIHARRTKRLTLDSLI